MGKGKAKRGIPSKVDDFNSWYPFIVEAAELVDKRYPIKGMDVWRPYGWRTMKLIDALTHAEMERTGHEEVNFPLLIPENLLDKENALVARLKRAREEGVDLVMIAEKSDPPVCKIVDYGKLRYQKDKKKKEQAKKAKTNEIKEVKMSYKIGEGDYDVRKKRADKFIKNGNRVKLSIQFRGREQQHMSLGDDLIARFIDDLEEAGANIAKTKTIREGRDLTTILSQKS